jgi:AcrR family transcriptional regulator
VTRARILDAALALFRERGFDATTMRDVAARAESALGAAYYYYPAKEALVLAYYERVWSRYEQRARRALGRARDPAERLRALYRLHVGAVRADRRLLGALVRTVADPTSPVSAFAPETRALRERHLALFRAALDEAGLPRRARDVAALALWALALGVLLYFVRDGSRGQRATRRLIDDAVALATTALPLAASPLAEPVLAAVDEALARAGITANTPT